MQYWPILMSPGTDGGGGGMTATLVWFGLIFVLMYLLLIRPQKKKQKEHDKLVAELKKGDKVVTSGGMFGTVFAIDEQNNRIVLKVSGDVKMEFLRSSIAALVDK